jgi:PAS domain-containing protein
MSAPADPPDGGATVSPWRGARPELVIAVASIVVAAAAGYLTAGWAGLSVAVTVAAAAAMVVLRFLLPPLAPDEGKKTREKPQARQLSGYPRRRFVVHSSIASQRFYDGELRPVLEHLLAARLAERHGVHLYQDPDAARRLLCRRPRDADLWTWIDPRTRPEASARKAAGERGIPRRTLARLIDRLERL